MLLGILSGVCVVIRGFTWRRHEFCYHFSDCDWFKRCELSIYRAWSKTCESGIDKANFVIIK